MALRNQPYFPLYVQDFLTDEKLIECSASSTGVYIRILCIMHKSKEYGTILLQQKDKQNTQQIKNFATKLLKHLPYDIKIIEDALTELIFEEVLSIEGDKLLQKRMIRDNEISIIRKNAGSKGGFAKAKGLAKSVAKTEYENEYEYENENENESEDENEIEDVSVIEDDKILSVWNSFAKPYNLTQVIKLTDKRKSALRQRKLEPEFNLEKIMMEIKESDFLKGKNKEGWKVDFDFVFCSKHNYIKILEGKYRNGTNSKNGGASPDYLRELVTNRANKERS